MFSNVNLAAPTGALAFLGASFTFLVLSVVIFVSLIKRNFPLVRLGLLVIAGITVIYLFLLFTFSFKSTQKVLAQGQEKYFCEIDCHLAYSIAGVRETKTLGEGNNQLIAAGMFRVVTIKTRFDETTISSRRGNRPLSPNSRIIYVVDESGNQYSPSVEAQRLLACAQATGQPFTTALRPAESYTTTVVFDLPQDIKGAALMLREGETVTHFVIGHENSPLHKKTLFQI